MIVCEKKFFKKYKNIYISVVSVVSVVNDRKGKK